MPLPGLFNQEDLSWTEADGLEPATVTDGKETYSMQVMRCPDSENWKDFNLVFLRKTLVTLNP